MGGQPNLIFLFLFCSFNGIVLVIFLAVQWLRLHAFTQGAPNLIPAWETKKKKKMIEPWNTTAHTRKSKYSCFQTVLIMPSPLIFKYTDKKQLIQLARENRNLEKYILLTSGGIEETGYVLGLGRFTWISYGLQDHEGIFYGLQAYCF